MKISQPVLLLIIILLHSCANSENLKGFWKGTMEMSGKSIDVSVDLDNRTFSSYDLMLLEQPLSNLKTSNGDVSFALVMDVEIIFNGTLNGDEITGKATINGGPPNMDINFTLSKQQNPDKPYTIDQFAIQGNEVNLSVNLYKPNTGGLHPAIVLLHGSTTNLKSNFTFEADYFAKQGFEVLIYDKRGNGESTGNYYHSSYNDLVADAIKCLEFLKQRESVDARKIGIWGYSQGAMLLPKVAANSDIPKFIIAKSPDVNGAVAAAAFSDSLRVVRAGNTPGQGHIAAESHREVGKLIRVGKDYQEVQNYILSNARKYPFMNQTGLHDNTTIDKEEFNGFYWQGRTENFRQYWENITIPTLVLLGERDTYLNAKKNASILENSSNENIEVHLFAKANHTMKKMLNPAIDGEFDWPRAIEGYTELMKEWLNEQVK